MNGISPLQKKHRTNVSNIQAGIILVQRDSSIVTSYSSTRHNLLYITAFICVADYSFMCKLESVCYALNNVWSLHVCFICIYIGTSLPTVQYLALGSRYLINYFYHTLIILPR